MHYRKIASGDDDFIDVGGFYVENDLGINLLWLVLNYGKKNNLSIKEY